MATPDVMVRLVNVHLVDAFFSVLSLYFFLPLSFLFLGLLSLFCCFILLLTGST